MGKTKFDFGGYATKNDIKCTDGRVIRKDAFKANDGQTVPLVWHHLHEEPSNVLGHVMLENRPDGVYAYGQFNDTETGRDAKVLVQHGDITSLSIHANNLKQQGKDVIHGMIREVSLVLAGANSGAVIDNLSFAHGDGTYTDDDSEAIICVDSPLVHGDTVEDPTQEDLKHAEDKRTVSDVFETLNDEQKNVVYAMIAHALAENSDEDSDSAKHSSTTNGGKVDMKKNVFDDKSGDQGAQQEKTLTHDQFQTILEDAKKCGSLRESFLSHASEYGVENLEILFPDAQALRPTPDIVGRDQTWVAGVLAETHHTPFSRIKSVSADLTADEARAKGYITGNKKVEEVFPVMKRVTTPTTLYKKQKLDRDDIIDITSFDIVAWIRQEMRVMWNEELARAILIGDGRAIDDPDHINENNIRPIWKDVDFYSYKLSLEATATTLDMIDEIVRARKHYKGSGVPTFYTTTDVLTDMLLVRDTMGRRIYPTVAELASVLRVSKIVEVEVMENQTREGKELVGILVNLRDYTIGADKGGQLSLFDDFDIDYNQYKYLLEARCSGCLTRFQSAVVVERPTGTPAG